MHKIITVLYLLDNKLVEGKAGNKHRPVNERKSSYTSLNVKVTFILRNDCSPVWALES